MLTVLGANRDETGDIAGVADGKIVRLTRDGASYDPSFTPDGSKIVFSSGAGVASVSDTVGPQGLALNVMDADGSHRVRLTRGRSDVHPDVSPDGRQVVFSHQIDDNLVGGPTGARLRVIDIDGRHERPLLETSSKDNELSDWYPSWSPAGDQIAFVRQTNPHKYSPATKQYAVPDDSIWTINANGTGARKVLGGLHDVNTLAWAPNGRRLAYGVRRNYTDAPAYVVDIDRPQPRKVASSAAAPTWSGDGLSLLYYGNMPQGGPEPALRVIAKTLATNRVTPVAPGAALAGVVYFYYCLAALPCQRP